MWLTSLFPSLKRISGRYQDGWLHRRKTTRNAARPERSFVPRLEVLEDRTVPSTLTVTNTLDKGAGSLRDAITKAGNGDTIVFAPSLDGQTITLTSDQLTINKNLDIEGPGASLLAISGNDTNRVFSIPEGNTVTIAGLTITNGLGSGESGGGGVQIAGSTLALTNDLFSHNEAVQGGNFFASGGALGNWNGANTTVSGCTFIDNVANGQGSASGRAFGGAIVNDGIVGGSHSTVTIENSTFIGNEAIGGNGGIATSGKPDVGVADGGAIENAGHSSLTVVGSTFSGNLAIAGNGGSGGAGGSFYVVDLGQGGALSTSEGSTLVVSGSSFTYNQAIGGSNATGGEGGFGYVGIADGGALSTQSGTATITDSVLDHNLAQGGSGNIGGGGSINFGWAAGGGIGIFFPGITLAASHVTLSNNRAVGGAGNANGLLAGDGIGGGFANVSGAIATLSECNFTNNQAIGGAGGGGSNGADGLGGALANILGGTLTVSNCTLSHNQATGSAGGALANGGNGFGGGTYNEGQSTLTVTGSTITSNQAAGGAVGSRGSAGRGVGGGVYFAAGGTVYLDLFTSLNILGNTASTRNNDVFGFFMICP
jgi:hypothetical protein